MRFFCIFSIAEVVDPNFMAAIGARKITAKARLVLLIGRSVNKIYFEIPWRSSRSIRLHFSWDNGVSRRTIRR